MGRPTPAGLLLRYLQGLAHARCLEALVGRIRLEALNQAMDLELGWLNWAALDAGRGQPRRLAVLRARKPWLQVYGNL